MVHLKLQKKDHISQVYWRPYCKRNAAHTASNAYQRVLLRINYHITNFEIINFIYLDFIIVIIIIIIIIINHEKLQQTLLNSAQYTFV